MPITGKRKATNRVNHDDRDGDLAHNFEDDNPAWQSNAKVGSRYRIEKNKAQYTWKYRNVGGLSENEIEPLPILGGRGDFNREPIAKIVNNGDGEDAEIVYNPNPMQRKIKYSSKNASEGALKRNNWVIYVQTALMSVNQFALVKLKYPQVISDVVLQAMFHAEKKVVNEGENKYYPMNPVTYCAFNSQDNPHINSMVVNYLASDQNYFTEKRNEAEQIWRDFSGRNGINAQSGLDFWDRFGDHSTDLDSFSLNRNRMIRNQTIINPNQRQVNNQPLFLNVQPRQVNNPQPINTRMEAQANLNATNFNDEEDDNAGFSLNDGGFTDSIDNPPATQTTTTTVVTTSSTPPRFILNPLAKKYVNNISRTPQMLQLNAMNQLVPQRISPNTAPASAPMRPPSDDNQQQLQQLVKMIPKTVLSFNFPFYKWDFNTRQLFKGLLPSHEKPDWTIAKINLYTMISTLHDKILEETLFFATVIFLYYYVYSQRNTDIAFINFDIISVNLNRPEVQNFFKNNNIIYFVYPLNSDHYVIGKIERGNGEELIVIEHCITKEKSKIYVDNPEEKNKADSVFTSIIQKIKTIYKKAKIFKEIEISIRNAHNLGVLVYLFFYRRMGHDDNINAKSGSLTIFKYNLLCMCLSIAETRLVTVTLKEQIDLKKAIFETKIVFSIRSVMERLPKRVTPLPPAPSKRGKRSVAPSDRVLRPNKKGE